MDGTSLHLVMGASNEGRPGIGFRVVDVPLDKRPDENNPYRSLAHVLCGNVHPGTGHECKKKVRGLVPLLLYHQYFFCFVFETRYLYTKYRLPLSRNRCVQLVRCWCLYGDTRILLWCFSAHTYGV